MGGFWCVVIPNGIGGKNISPIASLSAWAARTSPSSPQHVSKRTVLTGWCIKHLVPLVLTRDDAAETLLQIQRASPPHAHDERLSNELPSLARSHPFGNNGAKEQEQEEGRYQEGQGVGQARHRYQWLECRCYCHTITPFAFPPIEVEARERNGGDNAFTSNVQVG